MSTLGKLLRRDAPEPDGTTDEERARQALRPHSGQILCTWKGGRLWKAWFS